jgi:hypothetical protein
MRDQIIADYIAFRRQAVKWARIALQNKRDGLEWHEAAARAHAALTYALLII